ncbi:MAG: hypothetical protein WCE48_06620, partial [Steroidobacteraceae bacterium]
MSTPRDTRAPASVETGAAATPGAASRPTRQRTGLEFGLLALAIAASGAIIWGVIQLAFPGGAALHSL